MLHDISEMVAIQPCESNMHIAFSAGGGKTGWVALEGVYSSYTAGHILLQLTQALKICSYIFILYSAISLQYTNLKLIWQKSSTLNLKASGVRTSKSISN